jgi:probable rRNA maturation factor
MIRPASPPGGRRAPDLGVDADRAVDADLAVFVVDEQADHRIDVDRWQVLARQVLEAEGIGGGGGGAELTVLFVDESTMAELNERFMGHHGPTDVLAFPLDAQDPVATGPGADISSHDRDRRAGSGQPLLLGDVVICPAEAASNASDHAGTTHFRTNHAGTNHAGTDHAGSYDDEIALLVVHGILHVLGMDHATSEEATVMEARQGVLLDRFHRGTR